MKIFVITLGLLFSAVSSVNAQDIISELNVCRAENNNTQRLACYDKLSSTNPKDIKSHGQAVVINKTNTVVSTSLPVVKKETAKPEVSQSYASRDNQVKNFGLAKVIEPEQKIEKITADVIGTKKDPYGKLIVSLENGQVWRQTGNSTLRIRTGDQVYVEEGMLGSYFLSKESSNKRIRVKRSK
ncbi:hypothetical protein [uncultured Paraglaciecola sp.]|uniref:hypothetical protein n=1 Tax=uncultured Paraglaciecola sp. TaxID=1765024 RepID=UPI0030D7CC5C|tara:strand:+ start:570 stop:1121 length:552 start_codon:yes stop_codon:yes gene_type:complete